MVTSHNFKLKSKLPIMFRLFPRFNYTSILVQIAVCWIFQHRRTHSSVIRSMKVFYCAHGELLIILHMQRASEPCTTSHHHQHRSDQMLWKYLSHLLRIASLYSTFGICSWRHTIHSLLWKYFLGIQPVHTWTTVRIIMVVFLYRDMSINEEESIKNGTSWLMDAQFCV